MLSIQESADICCIAFLMPCKHCLTHTCCFHSMRDSSRRVQHVCCTAAVLHSFHLAQQSECTRAAHGRKLGSMKGGVPGGYRKACSIFPAHVSSQSLLHACQGLEVVPITEVLDDLVEVVTFAERQNLKASQQ